MEVGIGIIVIILLVCGVYIWGSFTSGRDSSELSEVEIEIGSVKSIYIISLIVPLVAFIFGSISLTKDLQKDKEIGTKCILLGIISSVVYLIVLYNFLLNIL